MRVWMRVLGCVLALALAGCSGTGGHIDDSDNDPSNIDLARNSLTGLLEGWRNRDAPPPVDPGPAMSASLVDSTGLPMALLETRDPHSFSILVGLGERNGQIQWRTGQEQGITTTRGLISATQGLGFDRADSDLRGALAALFGGGPQRGYTRVHRALDGEGQMQAEAFVCDLAAAGTETLTHAERRFDTRIMVESCTGALATFENRYWVDGGGKIRASEQWVGPAVGAGARAFRIELLSL